MSAIGGASAVWGGGILLSVREKTAFKIACSNPQYLIVKKKPLDQFQIFQPH
jgi:hypothetical protein